MCKDIEKYFDTKLNAPLLQICVTELEEENNRLRGCLEKVRVASNGKSAKLLLCASEIKELKRLLAKK